MNKVKEVEVNGKTWNKSDIKDLLQRNDKAVIRGMLIIYGYQTADEQEFAETSHSNGIGFNGVDAEILTNFVNFYSRNGYLSPKQLEIARKKMLKYSQQLLNYMYYQKKGNNNEKFNC